MIYRKHRALSEKTTSVEDPIQVVQRGIISFIPGPNSSSVAGAFLIPTQVANPVHLDLQAMSSFSAGALSASAKSGGWYSDLVLYHATNAASSAFGVVASIVSINEIGKRLRIANGKLYVALASMSAGKTATASLGLTDYWRQLEEFGSNSQKYLRVVIPAVASLHFKLHKQRISYVVTGYEY